MPDNSKHDAIARQWELLQLLPSRGNGKSSTELVQQLEDRGFTVDKRTVQRDLVGLSLQFAIEADESAKPYRWRWSAEAHTDLRGIEVAEAVSLKLLESHLRPLLPAAILSPVESRFRLAGSKLASLPGSHRASRWTDKIGSVLPSLGLLPPSIRDGVLETVQEALFSDEQIDVSYLGLDATAARQMRLHPLALVQRGPVVYLLAVVSGYSDVRIFAVHRIDSAIRTDAPVKRPAGFSLDAFIATGALEFGEGTPQQIRLKARVSPTLARHLQETPLSTDMSLQADDGAFTVSATVRHTWQLEWWILSQGADMTVVRPVKLRRKIRDAHGAAYNAYGND